MFLGSEKTSNRIRAAIARPVATAGFYKVTSIKLRSRQKEIHGGEAWRPRPYFFFAEVLFLKVLRFF